MKKFLILGANGMVGHLISIYLIESGYDVSTLTRRPFPYGKNIVLEASDFISLKRIILNSNFDFIINSIGVLNDKAEKNKSLAVQINSLLPLFLMEITSNTNTKIIHLSTDCVFSGNSEYYLENSIKDGQSFYDKTKALGEIINNKDITFRNSIVGPDISENGIGLLNWFLKQTDPIFGYSNVLWNGVTSLELSKAIVHFSENNYSGIYHLVNNEPISKLNLLRLFNKYFRNNEVTIIDSPNKISNKVLKNTRTDVDYNVPDYDRMIYELSLWFKNHNIYGKIY